MFYFIYGDKPLLIKYDELIKSIKKENPNIPTKVYDLSQSEEEDFLEKISTNSMFISKELFVVKRSEKSKKLENILKIISDYDLSKKEIVFIYEQGLDDFGRETNKVGTKVLALAEKLGQVIVAKKSLEKKGIQFYVENELEISEYESEKIADILGDDFLKVKNEVEKIKNFLNGNTFVLENIMPILSVSNEYNLKNLVDEFMVSENLKTVLKYLKKTKEYLLFLTLLSEEIVVALKLVELKRQGEIRENISYNQFKDEIYPKIKKYFKTKTGYVKEYPIFLKRGYISKFKEDFLLNKINEMLKLEYAIKNGEIDEDIGVEKYLINFEVDL